MDPTGPIARRFPLVARPRPPCRPPDVRVKQLRALADNAAQTGDQAQASAVYNQAALLASDIGLPNLARRWCHEHAAAYLQARPLSAPAARRALEPLVNLARLHIRAGRGDRAHELLEDLNHAVQSRTDTIVDGVHLPSATLTTTNDDHRHLCKWLWTVLLADGARALTTAGRWQDARAYLQQHKGIGQRMLDGRQVAVLAHATEGEPDQALRLLKATTPGEPWENAVTSCLTVLCQRQGNQPVSPNDAAMLDRYQQLGSTPPSLTVFHTRLGISVIDALGGIGHPAARQIAADLVRRTMSYRDGYAARETLAHDGCAATLSERQRRSLTDLRGACALGRKHIPGELAAELSVTLAVSKAVLSPTLAGR